MPLEVLVKDTDNDHLWKSFQVICSTCQGLNHPRKDLQVSGNGDKILITQVSWCEGVKIRNMKPPWPLPCATSLPLCTRGSKGHPVSSSCKLWNRRDEKQAPTFHVRNSPMFPAFKLSKTKPKNQRKTFLIRPSLVAFVSSYWLFFDSTPSFGYQFICKQRWMYTGSGQPPHMARSILSHQVGPEKGQEPPHCSR